MTVAEDLTIICNEEGRLLGLPHNCKICGVDFVGPIIFVGVEGDELTDIPIAFKDFKALFRSLWDKERNERT